MLPICAACKRIRDDKGYWEQVETYLGKHSEIVFSHGLCPTCLADYEQEFGLKDRKASRPNGTAQNGSGSVIAESPSPAA